MGSRREGPCLFKRTSDGPPSEGRKQERVCWSATKNTSASAQTRLKQTVNDGQCLVNLCTIEWEPTDITADHYFVVLLETRPLALFLQSKKWNLQNNPTYLSYKYLFKCDKKIQTHKSIRLEYICSSETKGVIMTGHVFALFWWLVKNVTFW